MVQYKRVYTDTIEGIEQAERLKSDGWIIYSVGLYIIDFYKKVNK
jgi:hypothetical protein